MRTRALFGFIALVLLQVACQKEEFVNEDNAQKKLTFTAVMEPVTRSSVDEEGVFSWTEGDNIMVISADGTATETVAIEISGEGIATFSTSIENPRYATYPPIASEYEGGTLTEVNMPLTYGAYDKVHTPSVNAPMVADLSAEQELANFRHIAGVVKVTVKDVPAGINKMLFSAMGTEGIFGKFPFDANAGVPAINVVSEDETHGATIAFYFKALESTQDMTFYVPLPLGEYTSGFEVRLLKHYISDNADTKFFDSISPVSRTMKRKALGCSTINFSTRMTGLAQNGPANSYIISEAGNYSFPAIKATSWDYIENASSARVIWESYGTTEAISSGDLISNVSLSEDNKTISFTASEKEGNAVIALFNASGTVLWSWHIWLSDAPQDQVYNNNAGTMMDRNLGATSAAPADGIKTYGLMYQWGRKDPFLNAGAEGSATAAVSANDPAFEWATFSASKYNSTVAKSITIPTQFMKGRTGTYANDWNAADAVATRDNSLWSITKSIYDPCPPGYRVPDSGNTGIWRTAGTDPLIIPGTFTNGYNFGAGASGSSFCTDADCWYPATGQINHSSGALQLTSSEGRYWSRTASGNNAVALKFSASTLTNMPANMGDCYRAKGMSVRCMKRR